MKSMIIVLLIAISSLFFSGCSDSDSDTTSTQTTTEFYNNVVSVLNQSEDDEPLDFTDNLDENSSFDNLL